MFVVTDEPKPSLLKHRYQILIATFGFVNQGRTTAAEKTAAQPTKMRDEVPALRDPRQPRASGGIALLALRD